MKTKKTYSLRTIYLLKKYINNKCTAAEKDELLEILGRTENNEEVNLVTQTLWQAIENTSSKTQDSEEILRKEASDILRRIRAKSKQKKRSRFIWGSTISLVAAILFLVFILKIPALKDNNESTGTEINDFAKFTSTNNIKKITFTDGSTIYLNTNSTLYVNNTEQKSSVREVWLEEGEAFFEIVKDENHPFIVHTTNEITTRVLGTSFNIQAYAELNNQKISVKTGSVQVSRSNDQMILESDNSVFFNYEKDTMEFRKIDGNSTGGWREGMVVFQRSDPNEIAFRLKQHYGIGLSYNKSQFKDVEFSAVFPPEASVETIAETLSKIYNLEYQLKDSTLLLN